MRNDKRPRLISTTVSTRDLDGAGLDGMWRVFSEYYEDVSRERFEADLHGKSHVILMHDASEASVQGFSTLETWDIVHEGQRVIVVYSGDTVVARPYWGQTVLQRAFLKYVMGRKAAHPLVPVYWYLITKGYKTYLLLARNFPEHWPRHDRPTPSWQASLIDSLSGMKFGDDWRPDLGVLRHQEPLGRLKDGIAPVDEALMSYPDVAFFVDRNPGYGNGDELCCIGRVGLDLWVSYMAKLAGRLLSRTPREVAAR